MRFVQREVDPEVSDLNRGGGSRGTFRETWVLFLLTGLLLLTIHLTLGLVVSALLPRISVERERAWFGGLREVFPKEFVAAESNPAYSEAHKRAQDILDQLARSESVPKLDYELVVLDQKEPNAFAFPGGIVGITQGALELADSDDMALAFILAHELGHFSHRDHLRGLGRQVGRTLAWSLVFGADASGWALSQAGHWLDMHYSRAQEAAADRFAIRLVYETFGQVEGADRFFRELDGQTQSPAWLAWWQSHPNPKQRRQDLETQIRNLPRE